MSFDRFLNTAVTIITPGSTTNGYGDTVPNWASTTTRATVGWLYQRSADEILEDRDTRVTEFVLYLDGPDPVAATDRVTVGGKTYEVVGRPLLAPFDHHVEVQLRLVEG